MRGVLKDVGKGWTARDMRGKAQLCVRYADGQRSTICTDIPWAKAGSSELIALARKLHDTMATSGLGLHEAYALHNKAAGVTDGEQRDWPAARHHRACALAEL